MLARKLTTAKPSNKNKQLTILKTQNNAKRI